VSGKTKAVVIPLAAAAPIFLLLQQPCLASKEPPSAVNLSPLINLLLQWSAWIFGVSGVVLAGIAAVRGLEIALSGTSPGERSAVSQRIGFLLAGAFLCFGAWFIVALLKGVLT